MGSGIPFDKLIRRCQRGDRAAWETIFATYHPRLRYYMRRMGAAGQDGEDLLQEVWVKAIRRIETLREPRAFVAWLYRIARNELYSRTRVRNPSVELLDEQAAEFPAGGAPEFYADEGARVHRALARLKPHHREVLTLNFMEALSYQQIAEILDVNPGTVKSRIFHAKQSLRRYLENGHE